MFKHQHPYPPFIPEGANKLIIGTLPPPRFTTGELLPGDVNFCYGSRDGYLWQILSSIFDTTLEYDDSQNAIEQRKNLLSANRIGICDIVECAMREKVDASDTGIREARLRPIISILEQHPQISKIIFMGGNSKNGPEYFFRKYLKDFPDLHLQVINDIVPRIHQIQIKNQIIQTVSLTAPSGSANRAIGSMPEYKKMKLSNPDWNTIDYRIKQYKPFFTTPAL